MGRWRGRLLFALILYSAGFLTAIYVLAPSDLQASGSRNGLSGWSQDGTTERNGFDSQAMAASVKAGLSKTMSFAEEQAVRLAETIKTQMAQSAHDNGN